MKIVAFTNCFPWNNQPFISPHEQRKKNLFIWPIVPTIGLHWKLPHSLLNRSSCLLTMQFKWKHLPWQKTKNGLVDSLLFSLQKYRVFGLEKTTIPICVSYLFKQIARAPFNLLMLLSNVHSSMHSRKNSIPKPTQQSRTNLNDVKMLKLISQYQF
jgi:hypothetical protein